MSRTTEAQNTTQASATREARVAFGADSLRSILRNLGVTVAAGFFLAIVGAFGTVDLPLGTRLLYWVPLMLGGAGISYLVALVAVRLPLAGVNLWFFAALLSVLSAVPITLLVWAHSSWVLDVSTPVRNLPLLYGSVLLISFAMTSIVFLANRPGRFTHAISASVTATKPVRFMERLPPKLKGAVIYAISAEDHYLRLHTSKGSDLILMRLSDAISELEGLEGAQTHRSWWVARDAVESARREGDRMVLAIRGGAEAPVSRPNVRQLREAGWY